EIPVAFALVAPYNANLKLSDGPPSQASPSLRWRPSEPARSFDRTSPKVAFGPLVVGGDRPVLVEVPLRSPLRAQDALRRELDGEVGAGVPEEARAEIVSVELDDASEIELVRGLRASMELSA